MKYFYALLSVTALVAFQMMGASLSGIAKAEPHDRAGLMDAGAMAEDSIALPSRDSRLGEAGDVTEAGRPYGLHYDQTENSWTLYAAVLQMKNTSVYGRSGEIAQIEYSLDEQGFRKGWIVARIDNYSFVDETSKVSEFRLGQTIQLFISGAHVSNSGVDWEKCPKEDTYCMYADFVEGGFLKSDDYGGVKLCPSNTIIHSGFVPGDWINGMLAWKIRIISNP